MATTPNDSQLLVWPLILWCSPQIAICNDTHQRYRPSRSRRANTPPDELVVIGLGPFDTNEFTFGSKETNLESPSHIQLVRQEGCADSKVSQVHFRVVFLPNNSEVPSSQNGPDGCWMAIDVSSNGTTINGDFCAGTKAIHAAAIDGIDLRDYGDRSALHPERWNEFSVCGIPLKIRVGQNKPSTFAREVPMDLKILDLNLGDQTSSATSILHDDKDIESVPKGSRNYHTLQKRELLPDTFGRTVFMEKKSGTLLLGRRYSVGEEVRARYLYNLLSDVLSVGAERNLVAFHDAFLVRDRYTILTRYETAILLPVVLEELDQSQLDHIRWQVTVGLAHLHSHGISHCDIRKETLLVKFCHPSPVRALITGFSEVATFEINDHSCFCKTQKLSQACEDVLALAKVIKSCYEKCSLDFFKNPLTHDLCTLLEGKPSGPVTAMGLATRAHDNSHNVNEWPFQAHTLRRRFTFNLRECDEKIYILRQDLYQLFDDQQVATLSKFRLPDLGRGSEKQVYCILRDCQDLLSRHNETGAPVTILNPPRNILQHVPEHRYHEVRLYYHTATKMCNVTCLLRALGRKLAFKCTDGLHPKMIQRVVCDDQWQGIYLDRGTFRAILERAEDFQVSLKPPLPDIEEAPDMLYDHYFGSKVSTYAAFIPTRRTVPPFLAMIEDNRVQQQGFVLPVFTDIDKANSWLSDAGVPTRLEHPPFQLDWRKVPRISTYESDEVAATRDDEVTVTRDNDSITSSPVKFRFSETYKTGRGKRRRPS